MRVDAKGQKVLGQFPADLAKICRALTKIAAGTRGRALIDDLRTTVGGSASDIVRQALYADCLRVVHSAVIADGVIEDAEIEALYDIIAAAAQCYAAGQRSQYGELAVDELESARAFLDHYAADRGPLGRGARIRWPGLTLCRRADELGEPEALERYTRAMTALSAEACRLGGVPDDDPRLRSHTDELGELRRSLSAEASATAHTVDRRVQAFLTPCRVFSAVQQASSIFENDPFDVEEVHREARASFAQLVAHATTKHASDQGKMLVVLGDSGAGKTHLLRGFRRHVQEGDRGFVVYAQLQSQTKDYSRYLLQHLVDSLLQHYSERSGRTGLGELASGLLHLAAPPLRERLEQFADDAWKGRGTVSDHVNELVNDLLGISALAGFDRDLLRVLVYALRPDPRTTSSVYRYLRCEDMNAHDRCYIGDVTPRTRDDEPHRMICAIARFAAATQRALVVMVDQVDLAAYEASATEIFPRAINALYRIVSEIPSAVVVVACLSDLYNAARPTLNRSALDRLESSPPLAKLQVNRSYAEIEAVVARRLSWLFSEQGTVHRREQPVYPIPEAELRQLEHRRLRDVLEWCHQFQAQCAAAGKIISADEPVTVEVKTRELDLDTIAAAWSEAIRADLEIPNDGEELLAVVAEAANAYSHEMALSLVAPPPKRGVLRLQMSRGDDHAALAIAVVNHGYQAGAFTKQIDSLRRRAKGMVPIAVRTLEFPRGRACDKAMGQLIHMRGRGAYLDASTLRALVAFQRFQPPFPADRVAAWKLRDRPISSLPAVIEIFDFDRSEVEPPASSGRASSPSVDAVDPVASALDESEDPDVDAAPAPSDFAYATRTSGIEATGSVKTRGVDTAPTPTSFANRAATEASGSIKLRRASPPPSPAFAQPAAGNAATEASGSIKLRGVEAAPTPPAFAPRPAGRAVTETSGSIKMRGAATPPMPSVPSAPHAAGRATEASGSAKTRGMDAAPAPQDFAKLPPPPPQAFAPRAAERAANEASGSIKMRGATPPTPPPVPGAADPRASRAASSPAASRDVDAGSPSEPATPVHDRATELSGARRPPPQDTAHSSASRPVPRPNPTASRPTSTPPQQLWIGNSTSFAAEPILLDDESLLRHIAIVDAASGARVAAALNLVEQALERGVPAILVDRTGEMSGYARPDWWQRSGDPARARRLAERIDVRLFTPGIRGGRPLSVAMIPQLSRVPRTDRDLVLRLTAGAVAAAMPSDTSTRESTRLTALTQALAALAGRSAPTGLLELIARIETGGDELGEAAADDELRQRLVGDLYKLLGNPDVFTSDAELLTATTLIRPASVGQVPLAIINTSFLGDDARLRSWIAHLVAAMSCEHASSKPVALQTLLVLDEAEQVLSAAASKTPSKEPLQELLGRAGPAGLGVVLTSRRPGDLDYRRCTSIDTWLVGKTEAPTLEKMKALFAQRPLGHRDPSRLEAGRFVMLRQGSARDVERGAPLLPIEPLGGEELKTLAARTRPRAREASLDQRANATG